MHRGTCLYISSPSHTTFNAIQGVFNSTTNPRWENPITTGLGYTATAWPQANITRILTLNFYDNYSFPGNPYNPTISGTLTTPTGLLTGSKTNVLLPDGTYGAMLWTVQYYDDHGRNMQTYQQHYLGGEAGISNSNYDEIAYTYDFTNEVTQTTRHHYTTANTGAPAVTIGNAYSYDHMGRKINTNEQINGGTNVLLAQLGYNEVGQVKAKHLHSTNSGSSFLQDVAYSYNERGWLSSSSAPLFEEQLQYNTNPLSVSNFAAQFNGNIASQSWGTTASPNSKSYTYGYDNLNRLTDGTSTDDYNEKNISYDVMGNITALQRYWNNTQIDNLSYTYTSSGNITNQLQSITDANADTGPNGYKAGTWAYAYDTNGNMVTDNSKGITGSSGITYNLLNLPAINTLAIGTISYTYDATGKKLRKVSTLGSGSTTDYIDGIQYNGTAIDFIQTDEGRVLNINGTPNYEYTLADHLGNSRVEFDSNGGAVTKQQDDYFPFGLDINRSVTGTKNLYLYNKKELQENLGLYDYGSRSLDPLTGRWITIDKESENYESYTPYAYTLNRPIVAIDPDGKRIYFIGGANNDQDGWNYIQRWQQTFAKNGINNFYRMNESNGKMRDISFVNNYRSSAYESVRVSAGRFPAATGETRPVENDVINKTVADYKKDLQEHPLKEGEQFNMVGYSYGSVLQAQTAIKLANSGQVIDNLVLIGSPISDNSDLYRDLASNKNIKNVIRYDIKGDAISNPQNVYDFLIKGGLIQGGGQGDNAHHFDAARPGKQADQLIDVIVKWLKQNGVKD